MPNCCLCARRQWLVVALLPSLLLLSSGCASYNWRVDYDVAETEARESSKYLFIYYKQVFDNASNRMLSEEVLSDPDVMARFQDTVNVLIDDINGEAYQQYLRKYGVTEYPAAIIVAPNGAYQVQRGYVPKARFMQFIDKAMRPSPAPPRPAGNAIPQGSGRSP